MGKNRCSVLVSAGCYIQNSGVGVFGLECDVSYLAESVGY